VLIIHLFNDTYTYHTPHPHPHSFDIIVGFGKFTTFLPWYDFEFLRTIVFGENGAFAVIPSFFSYFNANMAQIARSALNAIGNLAIIIVESIRAIFLSDVFMYFLPARKAATALERLTPNFTASAQVRGTMRNDFLNGVINNLRVGLLAVALFLGDLIGTFIDVFRPQDFTCAVQGITDAAYWIGFLIFDIAHGAAFNDIDAVLNGEANGLVGNNCAFNTISAEHSPFKPWTEIQDLVDQITRSITSVGACSCAIPRILFEPLFRNDAGADTCTIAWNGWAGTWIFAIRGLVSVVINVVRWAQIYAITNPTFSPFFNNVLASFKNGYFPPTNGDIANIGTYDRAFAFSFAGGQFIHNNYGLQWPAASRSYAQVRARTRLCIPFTPFPRPDLRPNGPAQHPQGCRWVCGRMDCLLDGPVRNRQNPLAPPIKCL
jgi:hypothetical protein